MFSVVRFIAPGPSDLASLAQVGEAINACMPGAYVGLDAAGSRFSCTISGDDACDQPRRILEYLKAISPATDVARLKGIQVILDAAFENQDFGESFQASLQLSEELLSLALSNSIGIYITIYKDAFSEGAE